MKVHELIALLERVPLDASVRVMTYSSDASDVTHLEHWPDEASGGDVIICEGGG